MGEQAGHRHGNPSRHPSHSRVGAPWPDARPVRECRVGGPGSPGVELTPAASGAQKQESFTRYVLPEVEVLLRVARTMTPRPADAEDLVQDTMARAFQSMGTFDGAHPRAWLLTIMRNAEINRTRRRRPELLRDHDAAMEGQAATEGVGADTPEALVVGATFDAVIADALAALPDAFRRVVTLVDVEGLSYAEAAKVLDVPVGTIMSRLHRARARMRHRLVAAGLAPRRRL